MDNKVRVIAFIGKIGVGKTTVAEYLVNTQQYVRLRFADKLKSMLRTLGLTAREVEGDLKECACDVLCGQTPRHAMITLGTEWGRDMIGKDIWVNALNREMLYKIDSGVTKFVIDDVRFLSEAKWVQDLKYLHDVVIESCLIRLVRESRGVEINHQSELEQNEIVEDWIIYNNYDLVTLFKSVDESIDMYFKGE